MSYCRWSSDNFNCDVYAYEHLKIVSIHIEYDLVNKLPTLVYTDENNIEWVLKYDRYLEEKQKSWYFKEQHKTK